MHLLHTIVEALQKPNFRFNKYRLLFDLTLPIIGWMQLQERLREVQGYSLGYVVPTYTSR